MVVSTNKAPKQGALSHFAKHCFLQESNVDTNMDTIYGERRDLLFFRERLTYDNGILCLLITKRIYSKYFDHFLPYWGPLF